MSKLEEFFTIEELCAKWKVSKSYIRKKIRHHELVPDNLDGRLVRFSESAVNEFLNNSKDI